MKTNQRRNIKPFIASGLMIAALAVAVAGCKSSGYEKGQKAAESIQASANQIAGLPAQIDKTLASLNALVEKPQPDLRPQFKEFSASLAELQATGKDISAARQAMGSQGKEFLAKWDEQLAQVQSEDIKARSQARREEVLTKLQGVKTDYAEAEVAAKPFVNKLKDIEKYLSVDLTTAGVASMKDSIAKVNQDADPLKKSIVKVADDFKALGLSMSSVTPQQPQTPAPQQPAK